MENNITETESPALEKIRDFRDQIHQAVSQTIVGQQDLIDDLLIAILCEGHILLEGVPGVAKTLLSKTLANLLGVEFRRIQFTPDMMPADIVGTKVFDFADSSFKTRKGPIFANVVLIDEVNRAPAKTQAALLEVMEERQVTIEGETFRLQDPFLVIATQNPIEFEGTYNLPEAQVDRFLMKVIVDYPEEADELEVLRRFHAGRLSLGRNQDADDRPVLNLNASSLADLRKLVNGIHVDDDILSYINRLVRSTRGHSFLYMGSSPRGNISLLLASKARAALLGRNYVNPDDVKSMALPVLRHRVVLSPEAEIEGLNTDQILREIADQASVPR